MSDSSYWTWKFVILLTPIAVLSLVYCIGTFDLWPCLDGTGTQLRRK